MAPRPTETLHLSLSGHLTAAALEVALQELDARTPRNRLTLLLVDCSTMAVGMASRATIKAFDNPSDARAWLAHQAP